MWTSNHQNRWIISFSWLVRSSKVLESEENILYGKYGKIRSFTSLPFVNTYRFNGVKLLNKILEDGRGIKVLDD